ncbi:MAG TPA: hypothetical protein VIM51_10925 [Desulfosporosinus sp.]
MANIIRPKLQPMVPEGITEGVIKQIKEAELASTYYSTGVRNALVFSIAIDVNGIPITLRFSPSLSWHPKSKLTKTLMDLEALPDEGEGLETDRLIGMNVVAWIKYNEKDGQIWTNITKIEKSLVQTQVNKLASITRKVVKHEITEDIFEE